MGRKRRHDERDTPAPVEQDEAGNVPEQEAPAQDEVTDESDTSDESGLSDDEPAQGGDEDYSDPTDDSDED
jgi:hypothetical protein